MIVTRSSKRVDFSACRELCVMSESVKWTYLYLLSVSIYMILEIVRVGNRYVFNFSKKKKLVFNLMWFLFVRWWC